jgi:hypothetical protein
LFLQIEPIVSLLGLIQVQAAACKCWKGLFALGLLYC